MVIVIQCKDQAGLVAAITGVLAKALQLVLNDKVFVYRNKTVVFE